MRFGWLVVLLLVLLVPLKAQSLPSYETDACPYFILSEAETEGETIECGWLNVPEDHTNAASDISITLLVTIIHSTSSDPQPDPVIYLEGGPGGSATSAYASFFNSGLRAERDIILIEQRGTGFSVPSLNCWETTWETESAEDPMKQCLDRLEADGVNVAMYTSAQNAADVAALIEALGYDEVNLWGISYGTRLALTVMRDHPEHIRSVIIDSVYPPQAAGWDENGSNGALAFQTLFKGCAADAACNAAYPDLEQTFYDAVVALDADPLPLLDEYDTDIGDLTGAGLIDDVFLNLYSTDVIPYLPARIDAAARRDAYGYYHIGYDVGVPEMDELEEGWDITTLSDEDYLHAWTQYLGFATPEETQDYLNGLDDEAYEAEQIAFEDFAYDSEGVLMDDTAEGMFNSVECYEEIPFNSLDKAEALLQPYNAVLHDGLLSDFQEQVASCVIWGVPPATAFETQAVVSEIPTLVLSGEYDPITPSSWGKQAADALPNSYHFIFPGMGHGVVDSAPCPTRMAQAFLAAPTAKPDAACIAEMSPPQFYTGE
jgi:pimeloyl-ACP methyl ester carboxylesterase